MGMNCTDVGTEMQPVSVRAVCYRIRMEPKDPRGYLWTRISTLAGAPGGSARQISDKLKGKIAVNTLQRLLSNESSPKTDTLLQIATALKVEVWELLVPPGGAAAAKSPGGCGLDDAVGTISESLGKLAPTKRGLVLQHLALYVEDPSNEQSSLEFVLNSLGGARDQQAMLKHAS